VGALNIQIIKKNGKKEYVVMPYDEFLRVREELDDYQNLRCLREAKEAEQHAPAISIENLKKHLKTPTRKANTE
jgi:SUMO ligase MMS21 Smc5/6 complex component